MKMHELGCPDKVAMTYLQMKDHRSYMLYATEVDAYMAGKVITSKRFFK